MACRMFATGKALVRAAILDEGSVSPEELRGLLFLRLYGEDFSEADKVVGELGDWHPLSAAYYLHKHIPHSRLVVFKGGRAMLPWDYEDDFNREVMTFLKAPPHAGIGDVKTIGTSPLANKYPVY